MTIIQPIHLAALIAFIACLTDLKTRRIPNLLTFGGAAVGLIVHGISNGSTGILLSTTGWLLGVGLFLPFFALRGLGGGDVKLLGAIGAWTGPYVVFRIALYSSIAGGILGLIVAWRSGYLKQALSNLGYFVRFWKQHGLKPVEGFDLSRTVAPKLAYTLPVFTGVLVTLWLH